jgi:hypothetical protein
VEKKREELAELTVEEKDKKKTLDENKTVLMEHREKLKAIIETCKALHEGFDEKRREVRSEKQKKIRELTCPDHAWGASPERSPSPDPFADSPSFEQAPAVVRQDTFSEAASEPGAELARQDTFGSEDPFGRQDSVQRQDSVAGQGSWRQDSVASVGGAEEPREAVAAPTDLTGYVQYRALYDYEARNPDELEFKVHDIIMVHPEQDHEPGWLGGELAGKVGWFPEAFAERVVEGGGDQALQPIAEVPENGSDSSSFQDAAAAQAEQVATPAGVHCDS